MVGLLWSTLSSSSPAPSHRKQRAYVLNGQMPLPSQSLHACMASFFGEALTAVRQVYVLGVRATTAARANMAGQ
jgi:hypothetical protein